MASNVYPGAEAGEHNVGEHDVILPIALSYDQTAGAVNDGMLHVNVNG